MTKHPRLLLASRSHCGCCAITKLIDGRCRVGLPPSGETHAISGTSYQKNHGHDEKLADGIVFWSPRDQNDDFAVCVELKGGQVEVGVASKQLQNATLLIEKIAAGNIEVKFAAVLASNQLDAIAVKLLRTTAITFRSKRHQIVRVRCGTDLSVVMSRQRKTSKR